LQLLESSWIFPMLSRISDVMLFSISRGFVQRYGGSATKGVGVGRSWGRAELGAAGKRSLGSDLS